MRSNYTMNLQASVLVAAIAATLLLGKADGLLAANEPENSTPQQVFDGMKGSFKADKAKGQHLKWQWELSGSNGGGFLIEVEDGTYKKGHGQNDHPHVAFITRRNQLGGVWHFQLQGTSAIL